MTEDFIIVRQDDRFPAADLEETRQGAETLSKELRQPVYIYSLVGKVVSKPVLKNTFNQVTSKKKGR